MKKCSVFEEKGNYYTKQSNSLNVHSDEVFQYFEIFKLNQFANVALLKSTLLCPENGHHNILAVQQWLCITCRPAHEYKSIGSLAS